MCRHLYGEPTVRDHHPLLEWSVVISDSHSDTLRPLVDVQERADAVTSTMSVREYRCISGVSQRDQFLEVRIPIIKTILPERSSSEDIT